MHVIRGTHQKRNKRKEDYKPFFYACKSLRSNIALIIIYNLLTSARENMPHLNCYSLKDF